ncbi:MAG: trypsin-like peptidase domain-containing protein [Bdellovibrionales bacterium]
MTKFFYSLVLSVLFSAGAANALPLPRVARSLVMLPETFTTGYNFEGIVALDNCSGSIVRFENSKDTDTAMVLTNGHCYEGGFMNAGEFLVNKASRRTFSILDTQGNDMGTLHATMVLYATMTKTDMTLYRLRETYAEILSQYKTHPLTMSSQHPATGTNIEIISGYWQRGYTCQIEFFVNNLKEGDYTWADSMRYSRPGCEVIGGTSGSPVIMAGTRTVIGINNTGNENGQRCTDNNPCEIDQNGNVTYQKGYNYAEETYWIYSCLDSSGQINVSTAGCMLTH